MRAASPEICKNEMGSLNKIIFLVFPLIINQFVPHLLPVAAKDVLRAGDELNSLDPTSTLASASGEFSLGFFTIEATNLTYLGIWYTNDEQARKVWVANRDMPLIGSGALIIDKSGTLKVIRRGTDTNTNTKTNTSMFNVSNEVGSGNTRAVLENSGNFVLYDNANDNIRTLWQSFDHPTNILLPGMKLGYNLTTRQNWTLTSWISDVIPASGAFKMSLEKIQNSPQLRIYRIKSGEVYWSSGPWKNGSFDKKKFSFLMHFPEKQSLVFDSSGMYFTFQTVPYTVSMLRLSSKGELDDGENDIPFSSKIIGVVIIVVAMVAIILSPILAVCLCYGNIRMCCLSIRRRRREAEKLKRDAYIHQLTNTHSFNFGDELEKGISDAPDVKIFSLKAILAATDNFSIKNKLGQGGYGPVYKGNLFDGRQIAVKRLSKLSGQGIEEFKNELILISKLQHKNLVRLYGCCIHQQEKMLVYEFMPNKSLDFFLFVEYENEKIDWRLRFNIIEGVAQGLLYLHKYSRMTIIHRDLKASNILLDEKMNPKIADFGTARIFQQNVTEAITHRVVGTYGYMAPEYAMEGNFSIKSDVFSFGVLILEIISGKRNSSFYNLDRPVNLVGYAWELWKGEAALALKDESLGESCDIKQLLKTIHVGLLCVQENADDRPTMSEVIFMFNNEIADLPIPKQPAFFTGRLPAETERKSIPCSVNGLTITMMEAR